MATRGARRSFGRKLDADGSTNRAITPATAAMMPDDQERVAETVRKAGGRGRRAGADGAGGDGDQHGAREQQHAAGGQSECRGHRDPQTHVTGRQLLAAVAMVREMEPVQARRVHRQRPVEVRQQCLGYETRQRCLKSRGRRDRPAGRLAKSERLRSRRRALRLLRRCQVRIRAVLCPRGCVGRRCPRPRVRPCSLRSTSAPARGRSRGRPCRCRAGHPVAASPPGSCTR